VRLHGGAPLGARVDFSTNLNALGPPGFLVRALRRVPLSRYPDPEYAELRALLGDPARVAVGAGASELIHRLVAAFGGPVAVFCPSFGEYAEAARARGQRVYFARDEEEFLRAIRKASLGFLASPNNPDGRVYEAAFLEEAAVAGGLLVLDLAYAPLSEVPVFVPEGVVRLYSPNKAFALPGVRAGYAVFPEDRLADRVRALAPSWVLSTTGETFLRLSVGEAARDWLSAVRPRLFAWRRTLARGLVRRGFVVTEGRANFLMARFGKARIENLLKAGVWVRPLFDKGLIGWARLSAQGPKARRLLWEGLGG